MNILIGLIILLGLWSLWGYLSTRVEQAEYKVSRKGNGYEIREYPAHIEARTTVSGSYTEALNQGFSIIAGYIFGGNDKQESVVMTAPVTLRHAVPEKIAMTAPVLAAAKGGSLTVSFVMPRSYTIETLPKPSDPKVEIVQIPPKKMAALRFSWSRSESRIKKKENELLAALARDKISVPGSPVYAGYNAPWTPPWMVRNEVMVELAK
jgi:hypothetical protein